MGVATNPSTHTHTPTPTHTHTDGGFTPSSTPTPQQQKQTSEISRHYPKCVDRNASRLRERGLTLAFPDEHDVRENYKEFFVYGATYYIVAPSGRVCRLTLTERTPAAVSPSYSEMWVNGEHVLQVDTRSPTMSQFDREAAERVCVCAIGLNEESEVFVPTPARTVAYAFGGTPREPLAYLRFEFDGVEVTVLPYATWIYGFWSSMKKMAQIFTSTKRRGVPRFNVYVDGLNLENRQRWDRPPSSSTQMRTYLAVVLSLSCSMILFTPLLVVVMVVLLLVSLVVRCCDRSSESGLEEFLVRKGDGESSEWQRDRLEDVLQSHHTTSERTSLLLSHSDTDNSDNSVKNNSNTDKNTRNNNDDDVVTLGATVQISSEIV